MTSRGTSKTSQRSQNRLRRAKTSPDLLNETREQDMNTDYKNARIAADIAYERAHGRAAGKGVKVTDQDRIDHKTVRSAGDGPQLERRQSVRFTGPNAEPIGTRPITQREAPAYNNAQNVRRNCTQSQSRAVDFSSSTYDDSLLTALPEDFGESDRVSVPSSYRRLRKAKSLFSPGKTPSAVFHGGLPKAGRHFQRHSQQSSGSKSETVSISDPRLQRSHSFLRGVTDRLSTANNGQYAAQDAAVQLARDTFLQQLEEQRLKAQPSFLNLSKRRGSQKEFRKTVRSGSTNSYGTAIGSFTQLAAPARTDTLGHQARRLSDSLRSRIKRVFRTSKDERATIPEQQLSATQAHYSDLPVPSDEWGRRSSPVSEPNAELLRRVGSQDSLAYPRSVSDDKGFHQDTIRSVRDDEDESRDTSRVSSWTNSSATTTISMPRTMERQRLSAIKEDGGPHQPSSSARFHDKRRDCYAPFRQPLSQNDVDLVQTERIFSALQHKLNDDEHGDAHEVTKSKVEEHFKHHRPPYTELLPRISPIETLHQVENTGEDRDRHHESVAHYGSMTPQEIAEQNELSIAKRPLREVGSGFFPPNLRIERNSTSPFRRTMRASNDDDNSIAAEIKLFKSTSTSNPSNSAPSRRCNESVTGSDSVYSRSPGGQILAGIGSDVSLARSQGSEGAGTAIIINKGPDKYDGPRYSSGNSSGEWKKFMAGQIASFEHPEVEYEHGTIALPPKGCGHRRESAQIDEDDVSIGCGIASNDRVKQSLAVILEMTSPQLPFDNKGSRSSPINLLSGRQTLTRNENTPLGQVPITLKRNNEHLPTDAHRSGGLREMPSQSPSKYVSSQKWLSTSPSARNSPERAERLRRLKNNSSTSLRKPLSPNDRLAIPNAVSGDCHQDVLDMPEVEKSPAAARWDVIDQKKLVDRSLRNRRSQMRITEESNADDAFL